MVSGIAFAPPPSDPDVLIEKLDQNVTLFHGHHRRFASTEFNPDPRPAARFSFFTSPATGSVVPTYYGGLTEEVAVAESLLHDVPMTGGQVTFAQRDIRVISAVRCIRPLRLAQLHGGGHADHT